jgi:hypothetical protein
MDSIRNTLRPAVILLLIVWSVSILLLQLFKGGSVGGAACYTDPTCGENLNMGYAVWAAWLAGIFIILAMGDVWRRLRKKPRR